jgi:hypothetical protein
MRRIKGLLTEIETTEKQWRFTRLATSEFHAKYDSCKTTHPDYYHEKEEEALRQQFWILKSQLRIAKEILKRDLK